MTGQRSQDFITVVSGVPRSGTSMMMHMLDAGGMPVMVDDDRKPDTDNPYGYYEINAVKKLKEDASWMEGAIGKAFKAIYLLLYDLPKNYKYRVVFVRRNLKEVIASQDAMLKRSGESTGSLDKQALARHFETQLQRLDAWLRQQSNMTVLYLDYADAVKDPMKTAASVSRFLDGSVDPAKMAATVDASLYRQRSTIGAEGS